MQYDMSVQLGGGPSLLLIGYSTIAVVMRHLGHGSGVPRVRGTGRAGPDVSQTHSVIQYSMKYE
jgi:hypothetical protein